MAKEMAKAYNPKEVEDKIYDFWMEGNYFHAEVDKDKRPYTIVMPPPNITGQLHMGHALDNTLQDILIRWRRMQGYDALWLPGTDHASIATEAKIVEAMKKEGLTKEDIGREAFRDTKFDANLSGEFVILGDGYLYKYNYTGTETEIVVPDGVKLIGCNSVFSVSSTIFPSFITFSSLRAGIKIA